MRSQDQLYHRDRERHCRSMAELASDPEVRRRHHQLAELHASRAAYVGGIDQAAPSLSAI